jgi:hypothetical protein
MNTDLNALYLRRNDLWNNQPRCNLAAPKAEKEAYKLREQAWLTAMHEIDGLIAAARKGEAA